MIIAFINQNLQTYSKFSYNKFVSYLLLNLYSDVLLSHPARPPLVRQHTASTLQVTHRKALKTSLFIPFSTDRSRKLQPSIPWLWVRSLVTLLSKYFSLLMAWVFRFFHLSWNNHRLHLIIIKTVLFPYLLGNLCSLAYTYILLIQCQLIVRDTCPLLMDILVR